MAILSSKAQGKQRAVVPLAASEDSSSSSTHSLAIRFTEGEPDLTVYIPSTATIRDVRTIVRSQRPHLQSQRLRFIHAGRVIPLKSQVLDWLDSQNLRRSQNVEGTSSHKTESCRWVQCAVGPPMDGEEEDNLQDQEELSKPARGFDRLIAAGLSAEDIENMRNTFHAQQPHFALSGALDSEAADEHARTLEEQWIESIESGNANFDAGNSSSSMNPILLGLICGFFFPLLPLFFFKDALAPYAWGNGAPVTSQPTVIFGRRMQMGIAMGLAVNVLFALWRTMIAVDDQHL